MLELADIQGSGQQMKGMTIRIKRVFVDPAKDAPNASQLEIHLQHLHQLPIMAKDLPPKALSETEKYQKMITHYRITIFAREIQEKIPG